jgi:hypothetical protein
MRTIHASVRCTAAVVALLLFALTGQAQLGPEEGAVLRNPYDDPAPRAVPKGAAQPESAAVPSAGMSSFDQILGQLAVDSRYAINRDIQPTPDLGPWMICVHSYITKEAPPWARQMAGELRGTYNLPAYVFTYGLEERRQEFERVKLLVEKQREFVKDKGLPFMYAPRGKNKEALPGMLHEDLPIEYVSNLLRVKHIPVQCAVLVGGYANESAAQRALTSIRELRPPDPAKVKLDTKFYGEAPDNEKLKAGKGEQVYVNPFKRAFLCRNPSVKNDRSDKQAEGMDINVLKRINADEPLTLLQCQKPFTLAIKEFRTYTAVQDGSRNVLENFGFKTRSGEGIDQAAHDAHNLAELLRKMKIEAYVLHTKFSSVVSVGGFDGLQDPNLLATQTYLERQLVALDQQLQQTPPNRPILFFPRPLPMQVPR